MEEGDPKSNSPASSEDDVLREQSFKRPTGLNLGSFMVASSEEAEADTTASIAEASADETAVSAEAPAEAPADAAVGELSDLFSMAPAAETAQDATQHLAVHGEQQLGKGLAVAMVVVWTAIGALVGTVLPPVLGALGLLAMAAVGLVLGERWIQRDAMHVLGITWVIISMKLLYGLALDAWRWGWLDGVGPSSGHALGGLLVALVGLNVALAFRHDEDAVAAQSALVLFAVGSSAGAVYGENGIAVMLVLAMVLMHGLAWLRSSGNLASLGISMSYLWVGVHALSNDWSIGSLTLVRLDDGLTLFVLLAVVTAANAAMAARFVHHENWLSQAVSAVGLGKPGLWAVSVSLGMVGALMAIAAHRDETGYALAQLMLLTLAFVASYLVVRGVPWPSLMPFVLAPLPFMLAFVALLNTGAVDLTLPFSLTEYAVFALVASVLCVTVLLMHQTNVSDHVLWLGSMTVVVLLTLLVPAEDGGTGGRVLLFSQGVVWTVLAGLAVARASPSMAGVAVLAPYGWLLAFATDVEARLVNADVVPIVLGESEVGWWMLLLVGLQVGVCSRLGEATLNLGSGLAGRSEISGRLRDSEMLNLWNLGFASACLTYVGMARPDGLTSLALVGGMGTLLVAHAAMVRLNLHRGRPQNLVIVWSVAALALAWRYGDEAPWAVMLTAGSVLFVLSSVNRLEIATAEGTVQREEQSLPGRLLTLHLGVVTALFLTLALAPERGALLTGSTWFTDETNLHLLTVVGAVSLALYLQRLGVLDALLLPSLGAVGLLVSMALAGQSLESSETVLASGVLFVLVGAYLAFQADVRSGLKALTVREERLATYAEKRARVDRLVDGSHDANSTALKTLDAELLALAEKQRKRAKRSDVGQADDLLVGDIHYRPVVLLLFLLVAFLGSAWFSYATAYGLEALVFSAVFAVLLVGLARLRANTIGLRLPDVMGVELPIAVAMGGLVLVHLAGRMTVGVLSDDALHQVVLMGAVMTLAAMGLSGRNDLGLRLPSALEFVVFALVADRLLGLLLGGEVPVPFQTDPFDGTWSWTAPLLAMEGLLVGMVLVYDWVEGERLNRGLADHRTAGGRSAWLVAAAMLSLGMATLLALVAGLRRGRAWQQPAVALSVIVLLPFSLQALTAWALAPLSPPLTFTTSTAGAGVVAVLWAVLAVQGRHGLWLSSALWACHLLLFPSAIMVGSLVALSLVGLLVSATAWVSGILTRRKSWRVVGAVDLVVAWLVAALALISGTSATYMLVLLVASAVLLFTVTALTQANEAALMDD